MIFVYYLWDAADVDHGIARVDRATGARAIDINRLVVKTKIGQDLNLMINNFLLPNGTVYLH